MRSFGDVEAPAEQGSQEARQEQAAQGGQPFTDTFAICVAVELGVEEVAEYLRVRIEWKGKTTNCEHEGFLSILSSNPGSATK